MPKFKVTFSYTETIEDNFTDHVTVEAADDDAAAEAAYDKNADSYDNFDVVETEIVED